MLLLLPGDAIVCVKKAEQKSGCVTGDVAALFQRPTKFCLLCFFLPCPKSFLAALGVKHECHLPLSGGFARGRDSKVIARASNSASR